MTAGPLSYTVTQVAERLGVSRQTVYRLIADGRLPAVPHLNPIRVAAGALDEFLTRSNKTLQAVDVPDSSRRGISVNGQRRPTVSTRAYRESDLVELVAGLAAIRDEIDRLRAEMRAGFAEIQAAIEALGQEG